MIDEKIDSAVEKCEKKDQDYIDDAVLAYQMLNDFFMEKNIDPSVY